VLLLLLVIEAKLELEAAEDEADDAGRLESAASVV
jgi:hypothetical protein